VVQSSQGKLLNQKNSICLYFAAGKELLSASAGDTPGGTAVHFALRVKLINIH